MEFPDLNPTEIVIKIVALMVAIIGHEIMHGLAAYKYGDDLARSQGRLSINPIVHIDPLGTIVLPLLLFLSGAPFLFGWAKPVPINTRVVLQNGGYFAMVVVSLAGIAYNLALAVTAAFLINSGVDSGILAYFLLQLVIFNVVLGIFNLLPVPPLDGANAIEFLARIFRFDALVRFYQKIERFGMVILILILATPLNQPLFSLIRSIILGLLR